MVERIKWTKEKIITDIKNNSTNGIAPSVAKPNIKNLSLAAKRHFGSWSEACK